MTRKNWSPQEDDMLYKAYNAGQNLTQIHRELFPDRTQGSVRNRITRLNLPSLVRKRAKPVLLQNYEELLFKGLSNKDLMALYPESRLGVFFNKLYYWKKNNPKPKWPFMDKVRLISGEDLSDKYKERDINIMRVYLLQKQNDKIIYSTDMLQYLVGLNQLSQNLNNFVLPYPMASMAMRLAALKQEKLLSDNLSDEQLDLIKECSELPDKELAETLEITEDQLKLIKPFAINKEEFMATIKLSDATMHKLVNGMIEGLTLREMSNKFNLSYGIVRERTDWIKRFWTDENLEKLSQGDTLNQKDYSLNYGYHLLSKQTPQPEVKTVEEKVYSFSQEEIEKVSGKSDAEILAFFKSRTQLGEMTERQKKAVMAFFNKRWSTVKQKASEAAVEENQVKADIERLQHKLEELKANNLPRLQMAICGAQIEKPSVTAICNVFAVSVDTATELLKSKNFAEAVHKLPNVDSSKSLIRKAFEEAGVGFSQERLKQFLDEMEKV